MSDFNLSALIRETLSRSREPDPHVIARRLFARIPQEHRDAALVACLGDRVRIEIGRQRMHANGLVPATDQRSADTHISGVGGGDRVGRSKWSRLAPALKQRYSVGGEWKMLADCTAEDCELIAEEYARRAAEQAAVEARFRELAKRLRAAGVATVADLGATDLEVAA